MARTFSCEMGCGWGMVPERMTRHRKGKKANSAGNREMLEMKEGKVIRREEDLKFVSYREKGKKMEKKRRFVGKNEMLHDYL